MHMSRLCVPDTTIGVRLVVSVTLRRVASGTIRFMKARVTTVVTSPICPSRSRCLTARNRRRNAACSRSRRRCRPSSMAARTRAESTGSVARGFSMKRRYAELGRLRIGSTCSRSSVAMMTAVTSGRASSSSMSVVAKSASVSSASCFERRLVDVAQPEPARRPGTPGPARPDPPDGAAADDGQADAVALQLAHASPSSRAALPPRDQVDLVLGRARACSPISASGSSSPMS